MPFEFYELGFFLNKLYKSFRNLLISKFMVFNSKRGKIDYREYIVQSFEESAKIKGLMGVADSRRIEEMADIIVDCYNFGGKILTFGNGGSAADAQHFVAELVGWYKVKDRGPLEALCLNTNVSNLTAIANDSGYDDLFSRQIEALGKKGDIAFGISTSGNSPNVVKAIEFAKQKRMKTMALTGGYQSDLSAIADYCLMVPSNDTPRVQEAHITVIHILCGLIEQKIFKK